MNIDLDELVLFDDPQAAGDTFIFEPSRAEEALGRLLVAAETEDRGSGRELIDTVAHALQREYYRDPSRGMLASFESALHQANLVLHDLTEQGVRDWMGSFHAAVGALARGTLHVSTAGSGVVLLARKPRVTSITSGLSHSPITDPLRTFAQVASGSTSNRDVLFFGTASMQTLFHYEDLLRITLDRSASTITMRLKQLYEDQKKDVPVAVLVVSMMPEHAALRTEANEPGMKRAPASRVPHLAPRQPLAIHRSLTKRMAILAWRLLKHLWHKLRVVIWPLVKAGSRRSGGMLFSASRAASKNVKVIAVKTAPRLKPRTVSLRPVREFFMRLPRSSKIFAVVALILALSLSVSLVLLQRKRAADQQFKQASELLHEARTKKEAAETALIYDNRDQARTLLTQAQDLAGKIEATGLYREQVAELRGGITASFDRLDKVTRVTQDAARQVGDFASSAGQEELARLFYLDDALYSYRPGDNTIVRMGIDGASGVVSRTSQGIGFFIAGTTHEADKSLVFITDSPGAALYDAKTELLQKQEISLPSAETEMVSVSTFGNRMYVYDRAAGNIFGYSKTLRGYSGAAPWITDGSFPKDTIQDIGVDGYIYTLHKDGSVRKLLKGAPVEFTLEQLSPPLSSASRLLITEDLTHLYIFDQPNQRVAIFDTLGTLTQQVFLGELAAARDITVNTDETKLYVLDGTKVWELPLQED